MRPRDGTSLGSKLELFLGFKYYKTKARISSSRKMYELDSKLETKIQRLGSKLDFGGDFITTINRLEKARLGSKLEHNRLVPSLLLTLMSLSTYMGKVNLFEILNAEMIFSCLVFGPKIWIELV